jgi:hypothetical protein
MPGRDPDPFILLLTASDPAAADLCASLLRSAGIESRLRGESLGPYRLTIGEMAATQVWVPSSRLEDARSLVVEHEWPGLDLAEPGQDRSPVDMPHGPWTPPTIVLGTVLVALALWLVLTRLF